ncbi:MAG TPA: NAD(P)/FAD-dependent oxidoreductase [Candidatus Paceibacterota bacterium]
MKILIVGGGIAGCACAALLQKNGVGKVTVVEKAPEYRNIGYLIALWSTGRKVLKKLGIDEQIAKNGCEYEVDLILDKNGRLLKAIPIEDFKRLGPTIVIRRADLHTGLFKLLSGTDVRFNTTCKTIRQEEHSVSVEFSDGKTETFDLVIGADGVRSSVREQVFGQNFIHYYGWRAWMWWLPGDYKRSSDAVGYYGSGKLCGVLPFFDTPVAALFAMTPPQAKSSLDERTKLKELFSDFCKDANDIVATAPSQEHMYYDDIAHVKMPLWHKGRVVLIGDAQHAVSPVTGMGASMAMEDAYILVEELRRSNNIEQALSRFAKRREGRIQRFRKIVDQMDRWTMADGILGYLRNKALSYMPTSYFVNVLHKFVEAEV